MPPIADPLFLLVALVALRVAVWIVDAARSRRRVAAVQTAAVRAGARSHRARSVEPSWSTRHSSATTEPPEHEPSRRTGPRSGPGAPPGAVQPSTSQVWVRNVT